MSRKSDEIDTMDIIYKSFQRFRTALLLLAGIAVFSVPARAEDVFTVSSVKVDVTAENAVAAREKAFTKAQTDAFMALAEQLLGEEDIKTYKAPEIADISLMIKDFEITDEQLSAVRYVGTYTFRFDGPAVRSHFNMSGRRYTDVASRPVLVLPFFVKGTRNVLWQDENPWLQAWIRSDTKGGLVPVAVPMGDIRDVGDINDDEALTFRPESLATMLDRYQAGEGIILMATPGPLDAGNVPNDLSVAIYRTDRGAPEFVQTLKILPDKGSTAAALYDKAVNAVLSTLNKNWKEQTAVEPGQGMSMLEAHVRYSTMQQWQETRRALQRVQGVSEIKVVSVTPREAVVNLRFEGNETRLRLALAQSDLVLSNPRPVYDPAGGFGPTALAYDLYLEKYQPY